jgi:hypothetical protein
MTALRCRSDSGLREWCRAGRIVGLALVLLVTGLPLGHSHPADESSVYDGRCPDARLAMGAPGASLPERFDGVVARVGQPTEVRPLPAEPSFRPLPLPASRAPPA